MTSKNALIDQNRCCNSGILTGASTGNDCDFAKRRGRRILTTRTAPVEVEFPLTERESVDRPKKTLLGFRERKAEQLWVFDEFYN
jgi:hypothetical protein